jgi:hypothetical protein
MAIIAIKIMRISACQENRALFYQPERAEAAKKAIRSFSFQ